MVSNILIDLEIADRALSECYFSPLHDLPTEDGPRCERTVGGRYLDRFERRQGESRIGARTVVIDWYRQGPSTSEWDSGRFAQLPNSGGVMPNDPLYRLSTGARSGVAETTSPWPHTDPTILLRHKSNAVFNF